jgi:hypothetical protein
MNLKKTVKSANGFKQLHFKKHLDFEEEDGCSSRIQAQQTRSGCNEAFG